MIVTVTPNPSLDRTLFLDTFTRGAVNRCTGTLVEPSGKGINVGLALHGHGLPVLAVFPVGGPAGDQLVQLLDLAGLPYRTVPITGTVRTNVSMIEADGTTSKLNEPGPALTSAEVADLIQTMIDSCSSADWLVISGTLPSGFSEGHLVEAIGKAHSAGVRVAVDSSGPTLRAALDATPELLKPNTHELAQVAGRQLQTVGDVTAAADLLLAKGLGTVLVSLGRDGAVLVDGNGALHGRTGTVAAVNTVGAGDAFLAGYLAAAARGSPAADRLTLALRWGAAAVQHPGTLFSQVDERIPVFVAAPDPSVALSEPAAP
jgi:1-phosphofructokinase